MHVRGAGGLLLTFFMSGASAYAHGGVSLDKDRCVLRIGSDLMHFTGYQPNQTQQEFCEDIPVVGPTVIVLDAIDTELRDMTTEIRVIRDTVGGIVAKTPVLADNELSSENLDPLTVSHLPAKRYPSGTVNFEHVFTEAGKYIGIVTVRNDHGQVYVSQFPFSVGRGWVKTVPIYLGVLAILIGGLLAYAKFSNLWFAPKTKP
ncbi:hypothetical protein [Methylocapsa palsarum]|uniref:Uncharacterized protein n=1 Tax=Methylocapsa palsarum TaxID=1612308 RepID=A0A1I3Z8T0_9HYPH|nr:hypothetical protein [Methylocapsa palsarum]SFK40474.1 hypothetical protein SAMN05444581_107164 [Methylocapsa palsarum]